MNLSMSVLGWFHTAACLVALASGAWVIVTPKGNPRHRLVGRVFVGALVFTCVTSLGIYSHHRWMPAHWFAVFGLATVGAGWLLARFKRPRGAWRYLHLTCMLLAYYDLIGGGVNEVYLRVDGLRHYWTTDPMVIFRTHGLVMLTFLALILLFTAATAVSQIRVRLRAAARNA